jgi:hypothetical protein
LHGCGLLNGLSSAPTLDSLLEVAVLLLEMLLVPNFVFLFLNDLLKLVDFLEVVLKLLVLVSQ